MDQRARRGSGSSFSSTASGEFPSFEGIAPTRPSTTTPDEETSIQLTPDMSVRLKVDAGPGCGGIAWLAGEVLSRYLASRHARAPQHLAGKTVLEVGSGTGLVGIAVGKLEPSADVWVTDQDVLVDLMRQNVELNAVDNVHAAELSWGRGEEANVPEPQVVLAADCVYFEPAFPLLVDTLCALAPVGKEMEVLFCWKKRRNADKQFFKLLKRHFDSEAVDDDEEARAVYSREGVSLLRLRRK